MTPQSRLPAGAATAAVVLSGAVAAVVAARSTGALDPLVFVGDAGPFVRWGVPLLRVASDASASLTVGALLLAVTMVPSRAVSPSQGGLPPLVATTRLARASAVAWVVAALLGAVFSFADAVGLPLTSPELPPAVAEYFWVVDPSRIGLLSTACALVVVAGIGAATRTAVGAGGPHSRRGLAGVTLVALAGLTLVAQASHSGTSSDHETSIDSLGVHLLAGALWAGGLAALLLLRRSLRDELPVVARRYSAVALWSYIALSASGVVAATTRFGSWQDLATPYGRLVVVKAAILALLGLAGWWHRTSTLATLARGHRVFVRLAVAEVVLMAVAYGVAAGLSRSAPPEPETVEDPSPALSLTGFPAPPEPTWSAWLTTWRVDWLSLTLALLAIGLYAAGLARARPARPSWPRWRTVSWMAGWLLFVWVTSGAPGVYGRVALSWHLGQLLTLALVVAVLLVLGRPLALADQVLSPRQDGTVGPREFADGLAGSAALARVTSLVAAGILTAVLLMGLAEPVLELVLTTHPGHQLAILAALVSGCLLASRLVPFNETVVGGGIRTEDVEEPGSRRLVAGTAVGAFCVGLGLVLWGARRVLASGFYTALEISWLDPVAEQRAAGSVAVTFGFTVLLAVAVCAILSRQRA